MIRGYVLVHVDGRYIAENNRGHATYTSDIREAKLFFTKQQAWECQHKDDTLLLVTEAMLK